MIASSYRFDSYILLFTTQCDVCLEDGELSVLTRESPGANSCARCIAIPYREDSIILPCYYPSSWSAGTSTLSSSASASPRLSIVTE